MARKILVVDDDAEDLNTMKSILVKKGYGIVLATNGAHALDLLKSGKPDLVLIDIMMPTLSGYDLLRLLRQRLDHKVKMAYVTIVPKQDVDLKDIDGFIQKPFSPDNLLKEVKKLIG